MAKQGLFAGLTRSEIMSRIRPKGNKNTELIMARFFRKHNMSGWRRHLPLPGTPDFTFPKQRVIVFVDGCFWHGCPRDVPRISTNRKYWREKLKSNMARDRRVTRALRKDGWKVLRVWEHCLKRSHENRLLSRLNRALGKGE